MMVRNIMMKEIESFDCMCEWIELGYDVYPTDINDAFAPFYIFLRGGK